MTILADLKRIEEGNRLKLPAGAWDETCRWAEANIPPLANHTDTWGRDCGAPRGVYLGHLVRMLLAIENMPDEELHG